MKDTNFIVTMAGLAFCAGVLVGCAGQSRVMTLRSTTPPDTTPPEVSIWFETFESTPLFIYRKGSGGVSVQWTSTNTWIAEWSTNMSDWHRANDSHELDGSNRHSTESDLWSHAWFLRLRRQ